MNENLLEIKNLSVEFHTFDGVVKAISDLSFSLQRGKTIGIVGETGAGKTTTALSIMGLVASPPGFTVGGEIIYDGKDLLKATQHELQKLRGNKISMIFQNPMTSLNPVYTVGKQIASVIMQHQNVNRAEGMKRAGEMLEIVGIPKARLGNYPHEFSGGMKQRVCIAMGLSCNPELLIADEPTTALDVTIQAQILDLMKDLRKKYNTSTIFITHALGVVAEIADYVAVVYAGSVIEQGTIKEVFTNPVHPYTRGLFACLPDIDVRTKRLQVIRGSMPDPIKLPTGCKFCSRCDNATELCYTTNPSTQSINDDHSVKCHYVTSAWRKPHE